MPAVCHVTIVGRRRADLSLPATVPIVQLVPTLVQLVEGDASRAVYLARPTGERLAADRTLTQLEIADGDLLLLRGEEEMATPPVVDDWVEALGRATEAGRGRWTASTGRDVALAAAAAGIAGAGGWAALSNLTAVAIALLLALLVGAACLQRILRIGWPAPVCAALALPLAGITAGVLVPGTVDPRSAWAVGLRVCAVGVAGLAAAFATPSLAAPFLAAALAALPAGGAALVIGGGHGTPVQGAAVLGIFWVLLLWCLPSIVVAVIGWRRPPSAAEEVIGGLKAVGNRVAWGRALLAWLMIGAGVALLGTFLVLSRAPGVFPPLLMVAMGLAVILRARHHHFVGEVTPLILVGLSALVLLQTRLLGRPALAVAIAVASSALIGIIGWLARTALSSVFVRRGLEYVELVANAALVPLAAGVLGLFTLASQLGHRL